MNAWWEWTPGFLSPAPKGSILVAAQDTILCEIHVQIGSDSRVLVRKVRTSWKRSGSASAQGRHYATNSFTGEDPMVRRDVASCSLPCQQLDISELVEGVCQRKASVLLFQTTLSRTNCVNARRNAYFDSIHSTTLTRGRQFGSGVACETRCATEGTRRDGTWPRSCSTPSPRPS